MPDTTAPTHLEHSSIGIALGVAVCVAAAATLGIAGLDTDLRTWLGRECAIFSVLSALGTLANRRPYTTQRTAHLHTRYWTISWVVGGLGLAAVSPAYLWGGIGWAVAGVILIPFLLQPTSPTG